jgi:hypothetical protein
MENENNKDEPKVRAENNSIAVGGIEVGGDISGSQITVGNRNVVIQGNRNRVGKTNVQAISPAELRKLRAQFIRLKDRIESTLPEDKKAEALQKADELQAAILQKEPDPSRMASIRNWFVKNTPRVAGAVTSLVIHPIVGKLVEAAGDAVVEEFRKKFG